MLKPIDVVVLAYLATGPTEWTQASVAHSLGISQSNVHRALRQLRASGLLSVEDKPLLQPFQNLVIHAIRHIYPPEMGPPVRGVPTAHSAPMLEGMVRSNEMVVWPSDQGSSLGTAVEPLHHGVPSAALVNARFYELMALVDVFRLGRVRERQAAVGRLSTLLEQP